MDVEPAAVPRFLSLRFRAEDEWESDEKVPPEARKMWNESDVKEWSQWIKNVSVRIMTLGEERTVPKNQIITAPTRNVRTTKQNGEVMQSQSHIIIPGCLGPQIGTYRTGAPTT